MRLLAMANGLRAVAGLPDPVGEVADGWMRPNGLRVHRVRVPLGVVAIIYENRPNVTSDAFGLCLKSGNAAFLRGSSGAIRSTLSTTLAELTESLGFSPSLVDSAADGRIVAMTTGANQLRLFSSLYAPSGTDALPLWGFDGNRNQATARYAFLSSDGNTRYAIVYTAGRYGLVTFP